jgi:serine/threonine-protein kinase
MTLPQDRAPLSSPEASHGDPQSAERSGALDGGTYFLGRYRVVDEIGIGGMASVHLARMDGPGGFQKWVAIKRIHPHLLEDETFVNMFIDEARVAARISHPNVAAVFELGQHEDTYWIAMEYLHGEPLREVMRRTEELGQPMPPEIACRVIADAAEGLHAAHELAGKNGEKLGLVHRDVTPHNLFVTYDGCTKVVDFGIAKFTSRIASTRAGTLKGKLAYMSPEQGAGEPIDRRTDVFALGVVLWELTTGRRLFRMESDLETMAKVQECVVPRPSAIVRGYPIDLEKIVMKALAKTKNERYRTARELSRALQSLLMRRGLFVAADEVSAYMQTVFGDRIQKREAHLRWAAEVTQTIDVGKVPNLPARSWRTEDGSGLTFNSDVQQSQPNSARRSPRPAAGVRPRDAAPNPAVTPPPPARLPRLGLPPIGPDLDATEDPTTRAFARRAVAAGPEPTPSFDDDFDDIGDTIVSDSAPDMDGHLASPLPAAGLPPIAPPPAVVVPPAPAAMQPEGPAPMASHSPADMQRLFAPPIRLEQRTLTQRSFRRRFPAWALAVGAAVLGLVAVGIAALLLARGSGESRSSAPGAPRSPGANLSSPVVLVSSGSGPFLAARSAFVSTIASAPAAPPPPPVAPSPAVQPPEPAPQEPSPPPPRAQTVGSPRSGWATSQSTSGVGSGTLKIICIPGCDQVIDNGSPLGPSPIVRRSASVGSHRIKLIWGDASKIVSTIVLADQTATVRENHP